MKAEAKPVVLLELADSVLRSWWTLVAGGCLGAAAAVVFLSNTVPIYQTGTTITLAKDVPRDFVRSMMSEDIGLQLSQVSHSMFHNRPEFGTMVSEIYGVPEDTKEHEARAQKARANLGLGYVERTGTLWLSYRDEDPRRATVFANRATELFIDEFAQYRMMKTGETTQSMEALAAKYRMKLEEKERELRELRARHPEILEGSTRATSRELRETRQDLEDMDRQIVDLQDKLKVYELLEVQDDMLVATGMRFTALNLGQRRSDARIAALERELEDLTLRYSDNHPDVQNTRRQIAELRRDKEAEEATSYLSSVTPWQAQIQSTKRKLSQLTSARERIAVEITAYDRQMASAPRVQQEAYQLQDEIDLLRDQYFDFRSKAETARGSEMFEEYQHGRQFEVASWAAPPKIPVWPDPFQVFGVGVVAGLVLFVGPVLLKHLLRPLIRSEARFQTISDIPLLVSIPTLATPLGLRRRRGRLRRNFGFSAISIAILVAAIAASMSGGLSWP